MSLRRPGRTAVAATLICAAVAVPCAAWYVAESRALERDRAAALEAPAAEATAAARAMAARVTSRLAALMEREDARPFFHYQNLFVDPRAAYLHAGVAVAPSPLADGPDDALVVGNFEVERSRGLTLPTINPEVAELNVAAGDQAALRERLAASVEPYTSQWLLGSDTDAGPSTPGELGAHLELNELLEEQAIAQAPGDLGPQRARRSAPPQVQEQRIPAVAYASNKAANEFYQAIKSTKARPEGKGQGLPSGDAARDDEGGEGAAGGSAGPDDGVAGPAGPEEVVVRVGPFALHTIGGVHGGDGELGGGGGQPSGGTVHSSEASLVALRRVETPDGPRAQGFVVRLEALAHQLVDGAYRGRLAPGEGGEGASARLSLRGAPWHVAVDFSAELAEGERQAAALSAAFTGRFALGAALVALAALAVIAMVAHGERLARRRVQFAAAAAHELRTPLAGVRLYGEMLAEGLGDPLRQREYARRVATEADRLGRVVSNVLDFTRLERGSLGVETRDGDLAEALREIAARIAPTVEANGASLALDISPDLPRARFDRDALAQIVSNLIDNAEKYSRDAGQRTIELSAQATPGGAVRVRVRDRGPGVPKRLRRRLFRPFSRGDGAEQPAGLGLGLALSRALVVAQGGDLTVSTPPDGGAAFDVTLPLAAAPRA